MRRLSAFFRKLVDDLVFLLDLRLWVDLHRDDIECAIALDDIEDGMKALF